MYDFTYQLYRYQYLDIHSSTHPDLQPTNGNMFYEHGSILKYCTRVPLNLVVHVQFYVSALPVPRHPLIHSSRLATYQW
jgi:hypothetical protein